MKKKSTSLLDEHLQSLDGMKEAGTDDFFYTRLRARMQRELVRDNWSFPLKPVWIVGTMTLLLAINVFMLSQQLKVKSTTSAAGSSLQGFAESYDQAISSSY
jgi:hypothetical protein